MKTLQELLDGISYVWDRKGKLATSIAHVRADSRKVEGNDLFVAIRGYKTDGHEFIREAIRRGVAAVVTEKFDPFASQSSVPQFCVSNSRLAFAELVARAHDFSSRKLKLIGVTGTNGKTTTTFLIQHLLNSMSRSGLIGSICYDDGKACEESIATTPAPDVLHDLFDRMIANQLTFCVLEVSSHALDQDRTAGLAFAGAVFTNLTQDHLDYHKDFETYYHAKRKLFCEEPFPACALINGEDPYGKRLMAEMPGRFSTYGRVASCDYFADEVHVGLNQIQFVLAHQGKRYLVEAPLALQHNVLNVLAALSVVSEQGLPLEEIIPHVLSFAQVPGRMEQIEEGQDFRVFVDYAHTPDALFNVLSSVANLTKGRVISVFGCGGDRDRLKRPLMGEIASKFSDIVVITSDNPRSEDPEIILREIENGIDRKMGKAKVVTISDRSDAIGAAVKMAEAGDLILIMGKGHEHCQIIGTSMIPFSDQCVARHWLRERLCLSSSEPARKK